MKSNNGFKGENNNKTEKEIKDGEVEIYDTAGEGEPIISVPPFAGESFGEKSLDDDDTVITVLNDAFDEITAYKKRADDMTAAAQRLQAEFDNYRRRTQEESKALRDDGRAEVIEKLLPVLDSFSQAVRFIKDKSVLEGVGLIYDRLSGVLEGFGVTRTEVLGQEFNPEFMNAVMTRSEKGKSGLVVEVILDGYLFKGKPLRPATVIVGD